MIGKNINEFRKKKGLTLSELADRAQISKSYLSNIERNLNQNPSIKVIKKIGKVLDVDLKTLLITGECTQSETHFDNEWLDFIKEIKDLEIEKEQIKEFKTIVDYIKWKNQNGG
ncbi:helix-turn-helix domain-containing protein [Neobacillus sp. LXY-4]|uniref:helix-turn-helix domain-containing protein n=1 Tax=Neobacillus sp. LXY-4 TaxID=3379826 RepID=UPI003EDEE1B6